MNSELKESVKYTQQTSEKHLTPRYNIEKLQGQCTKISKNIDRILLPVNIP